MPIDQDTLTDILMQAFPDALIELKDLMGDQDHFSLCITSAAFQGKNRLQQHKMVYDALGSLLKGQLHALSIQTKAKENL